MRNLGEQATDQTRRGKMDLKEKKSPPWDRGLVLDGTGKTVDVFSPGSSPRDGDSLFSMLTDSDAARLSEFCATAPTPARDPAAFAANVAVFDLKSRRFGTAVAVKNRVFSGNHTVVYLVEGKNATVRFPDFIIEQLPERIRPVISVLNGGDASPPGDFPLYHLACEMKKRAGIDGTKSLEALVRTVVRRLSAYPELCCGAVELTGRAESGFIPPSRVSPFDAASSEASAPSFSSGIPASISTVFLSNFNSVTPSHIHYMNAPR